MRELADVAAVGRRWPACCAAATTRSTPPTDYAALLLDAGLRVDAWETSYVHVLPGADPVLEWVRGTGLRPVLGGARARRRRRVRGASTPARCARRTRRGPHGTVLPFRRIFAVGHEAVITGYDHVQVAIPAGGEDAARAFYGGLLGMTEQPKPPVLAARGGCWFASGAAVLHLGVEEPFAPGPQGPSGVPGRRPGRAARPARARPVTPARADGEIPGVRRFHCADPFGNRLEFQQA